MNPILSMRNRAIVRALAVSATLLAGCAAHPAHPATRPIGPYTGPTDPLDVVLARINANNARITTVAGSGTFSATLGLERRYLNGQITLLHTKPDKLWLRLDKPAVGDLLLAGTNGERFWLSVFGDVDTTWYGVPGRAEALNPRLLISPTLIADVLGVATLNTDLLAQPVPTMRFNPDYDAYMLTWHVPITDRWVTLREVWYDRTTLEPRYVWLFDRNGRVTLRAKLGDVLPMDDARDGGPRVARAYDLYFPDSQSRLTFRLDELRATRGKAPNALTYRFDPAHTGTAKVENLDEPPARN